MKKEHKRRQVEIFVDKLIPYALILLLILIIGEIFFSDKLKHYSSFVSIVDGSIIGVFAVDLFFKYSHARSIPWFLRKYWMEIIALFPAFLIVRVMEEIITITRLEDTIRFSQEALEVTQKTGLGSTRVSYFSRLIVPLARFPRFFAAFHFYEKPTHRHLHKHIYRDAAQIKENKK